MVGLSNMNCYEYIKNSSLEFNPDAPCQCNDLCVGYGDCCMDYGDVCGVKSLDDNSCDGRCDDGKKFKCLHKMC